MVRMIGDRWQRNSQCKSILTDVATGAERLLLEAWKYQWILMVSLAIFHQFFCGQKNWEGNELEKGNDCGGDHSGLRRCYWTSEKVYFYPRWNINSFIHGIPNVFACLNSVQWKKVLSIFKASLKEQEMN